jgi:hypothetical protein
MHETTGWLSPKITSFLFNTADSRHEVRKATQDAQELLLVSMAERVNATRAATQVPGSSKPSHTSAPQEVAFLPTYDVMAHGLPTEAYSLMYTRKTRINLSRVRVKDWELRG